MRIKSALQVTIKPCFPLTIALHILKISNLKSIKIEFWTRNTMNTTTNRHGNQSEFQIALPETWFKENSMTFGKSRSRSALKVTMCHVYHNYKLFQGFQGIWLRWRRLFGTAFFQRMAENKDNKAEEIWRRCLDSWYSQWISNFKRRSPNSIPREKIATLSMHQAGPRWNIITRIYEARTCHSLSWNLSNSNYFFLANEN